VLYRSWYIGLSAAWFVGRLFGRSVKGTPLRSALVTHLKRRSSKTYIVLLSTHVRHSNLSCGTLICLLSDGNSFKTCIISVDLGNASVILFSFNRYILFLNGVAKSIEDILWNHTISFDTLNTFTW